MNATITLDVLGTTQTGVTFNIYQDVDLYTTPVATNISAATLTSGYSVTLNDNSTTVRVLSNGSCGNFKDIYVNKGDTSPSFIQQYEAVGLHHPSGSITGNGKSEIFASDFTTNPDLLYYSTDNGDTFTSNVWPPVGSSIETLSPEYTHFIHDGTNLYVVCSKNSTQDLYVYRITNYSSGFSSATITLVNQQTIGESFYLQGLYYLNNIYYAVTSIGVLRTDDLASDFLNVLPYSKVTSMDNYGKNIYVTIYGTISTISTGVFKSTDNGLNWSRISGAPTHITSINVDSATNHVLVTANNTTGTTTERSIWYTTNNGGTYTYINSTNLISNKKNYESFVKKCGPVYVIMNWYDNNYQLYYTSNIYTSSVTFNYIDGDWYTITGDGVIPSGTGVLFQRNVLTVYNQGGTHSYVVQETI